MNYNCASRHNGLCHIDMIQTVDDALRLRATELLRPIQPEHGFIGVTLLHTHFPMGHDEAIFDAPAAPFGQRVDLLDCVPEQVVVSSVFTINDALDDGIYPYHFRVVNGDLVPLVFREGPGLTEEEARALGRACSVLAGERDICQVFGIFFLRDSREAFMRFVEFTDEMRRVQYNYLLPAGVSLPWSSAVTTRWIDHIHCGSCVKTDNGHIKDDKDDQGQCYKTPAGHVHTGS